MLEDIRVNCWWKERRETLADIIALIEEIRPWTGFCSHVKPDPKPGIHEELHPDETLAMRHCVYHTISSD